jgi:hypothetical protein
LRLPDHWTYYCYKIIIKCLQKLLQGQAASHILQRFIKDIHILIWYTSDFFKVYKYKQCIYILINSRGLQCSSLLSKGWSSLRNIQ